MSTVGGMHGGGGDGAGGEGRGVVGSGDIPKMTSANMIVLLLMPALIVAIFMICLIYLSGCRCKLGSQKGKLRTIIHKEKEKDQKTSCSVDHREPLLCSCLRNACNFFGEV